MGLSPYGSVAPAGRDWAAPHLVDAEVFSVILERLQLLSEPSTTSAAIGKGEHGWDDDPARLVREQRRIDAGRIGWLSLSVLLDTTVLIDLLRGRAQAIERLAALRQHGEPLFTTAINVEQVHRGIRSAERAAVNRLFAGRRIAPDQPCGGRPGR